MLKSGTAVADRYRVERELGAGGMATVYLAHDLRHDRRVALKVMRPELAAVVGAARFLAEIRTTANLQHPHILPLFDSGEVDGSVYYVMPYVDGESLRDRLERERQLPVDEAIAIAAEVAGALDYAHRQGVVHRDIKPENLLLHDGRVMVADFGIALAMSRSEGRTRLTETGMSLGTPHYMSPEQAMGEREISARSDVYALGCVLYEMLAGEPPFTGPTAQAIVARVLTDAPRSLAAQRHTVPAHVDAAVRRALEKLPADRYATAAQFAEALRTPALTASTMGAAPAAAEARHGARARLVLPLAAMVLAAGVFAAWGWLRPAPAPRVSRWPLEFAPGSEPRGPVVLSRSGNLLVYSAPAGPDEAAASPGRPRHQLWAKRRDQVDAVPIPGTLGAEVFAISPADDAIAFAVASSGSGNLAALRRVAIAGGQAVTLADSVTAFGLAWTDDGQIIFPRGVGGGVFELWRIPADGGTPARIWRADSTGALALPHALPGGRGVLVTRWMFSGGRSAIWGVDLASGEARQLVADAQVGIYAPSGHLLYGRGDGALLAVPFDARTLATQGAPIPVADGVEVIGNVLPLFSVAMDGTLFLAQGKSSRDEYTAVWVDRRGQQQVVDTAFRFNPLTHTSNAGWALSPDGTRLAIGINTDGNDDIWVKQLPAGPLTRVTFDTTSQVRPRWTPDGRSVTYVSEVGGGDARFELRQKRADGTGRDSVLLRVPHSVLEGRWTADGEWLLVRIGDDARSRDILGVRRGGDTVPVPLVAAPGFHEAAVAPSPDGRWLAYESDEAGAAEVFLRPFPDTDAGKWQVSSGGGFAPLWSRDGRELFFINPRRQMVAVTVGPGDTPRLGEPRVLFTLPPGTYGDAAQNYAPNDVSADGSRFLMARRLTDATRRVRHVMVEHFAEELRRKDGKR